MLKTVFFALALFAISGCATRPIYHLAKGATVADGMRVLADCRAEAVAKSPQTVALVSPLFALAAITTVNVRQTYIDDCMVDRGYQLCGLHGCDRT